MRDNQIVVNNFARVARKFAVNRAEEPSGRPEDSSAWKLRKNNSSVGDCHPNAKASDGPDRSQRIRKTGTPSMKTSKGFVIDQ
jgi:hypothetical protein